MMFMSLLWVSVLLSFVHVTEQQAVGPTSGGGADEEPEVVTACTSCDANAVCENLSSQKTCVCTCGYVGNGKSCRKVTLEEFKTDDGKGIYVPHTCKITRNRKLFTIPKLTTRYTVKFQLMPSQFRRGWTSVIHFTDRSNHGRYGDRNPGIWFWSTNPGATKNRLHICSPVNGNVNSCTNTKVNVPKGQWTDVEVRQNLNGSYFHGIFHQYVVKVGDSTWIKMNLNIKDFTNVHVFASDPWHNAAQGYIRRLTILPEVDAVNMDNLTQVAEIPPETKATFVGDWKITYSTSVWGMYQARYNISADGRVKISWRNWREYSQETDMRPSLDESNFPTSEGWVSLAGLYTQPKWEFLRLRTYDGITFLQIEQFATNGRRTNRMGLPKYFCYGAGLKDSPLAGANVAETPLPIPNAPNWHDQGEVCFGATKENNEGKFNLTQSGKLKGIALTHLKGWINCRPINPDEGSLPTFFGCTYLKEHHFTHHYTENGKRHRITYKQYEPKREVGTVISTPQSSIIFPSFDESAARFDASSKTIAFSNLLNPIHATAGQEFQIRYKDTNPHYRNDGSNQGEVCVFVRAYIE